MLIESLLGFHFPRIQSFDCFFLVSILPSKQASKQEVKERFV